MDSRRNQLVLRLQFEDVDNYFAMPVANASPDEIAAFRATRAEVVKKAAEINDLIAVMDLQVQQHRERADFQRLVAEERQAQGDHTMAARLAGQAPVTQPRLPNHPLSRFTIAVDYVSGRDLQGELDARHEDEEPLYELNSAMRGLSLIECSSCLEGFNGADALEMPCPPEEGAAKHAYCRDCLVEMFETAIRDTSVFPPRCCNPLELARCRAFLPEDLIRRFEDKQEELSTPNRTYCSRPTCAKWIKPQHIEADIATCAECGQGTCTVCKTEQHNGLCPEDENTQVLMSLARRNRWQSCTEYGNMVELNTGCYHITCRCSHQFCYLCQEPWKSCDCPPADERAIWPEAAFIPHVHTWERLHEETTCPECDRFFHNWILRCTGCDRRSCGTCARGL